MLSIFDDVQGECGVGVSVNDCSVGDTESRLS